MIQNYKTKPLPQLIRARLDSCCNSRRFQCPSMIINLHLEPIDQVPLQCKPEFFLFIILRHNDVNFRTRRRSAESIDKSKVIGIFDQKSMIMNLRIQN